MTGNAVLERYISFCSSNLEKNERALAFLRRHGLSERFIFENFQIGYSIGNIEELVSGNDDLNQRLAAIGVVRNGKEIFKNRLIIPIVDGNKVPVNIAAYSIHPQTKNKLLFLSDSGIFNQSFLQNADEILFTETPLDALLLIQQDYPNVTFMSGSDQKYVKFIQDHGTKSVVFTFEGGARLFYELSKNGISTRRAVVDFERLQSGNAKEYLESLLSEEPTDEGESGSDTIQEIENGFLFQFPHLNYRVLGNFSEHTMNLKAYIKAYDESEVFMDSVDLYKSRDRQNFIFKLMDQFDLRDQLQLEQDLKHIVEVIEKHKERRAQERKRSKPQLSEHQRNIGMRFLSEPDLIERIAVDYDKLGYVRERKNKLLLYLVMTSRLMDSPLHAIAVSRSGAGKSMLAEITESLCPAEDVESISDLSANAMYYYGEDDLVHKFILIGEKAGSESSEYPLRELISRKSITKAVPMKDASTGQTRTTTITVNGPISLIETTSSGELNPENLNRCFVIGIDESEEQTQRIHELQRRNYTIDGFLHKREIEAIRQKHIFAQRLLEPVQVFNQFAEYLTFPSSTLRSRRDNDKFLRLITAVCFLHQHQRERKALKLGDTEEISYIECSLEDYQIAYELLSEGVLDNTLDDLPRPARQLLDITRHYVEERAKKDKAPPEKIIFERKDIKEYSSWSFSQVKYNLKILQEYEYLRLIKAQNGLANQYRLNCGYGELDFMGRILSPEELKRKLTEGRAKENPEKADRPG